VPLLWEVVEEDQEAYTAVGLKAKEISDHFILMSENAGV